MSRERYQPELGQMLFGNPTGEYEMPEYAGSLLHGLLNEFERIFRNMNQKQWDRDEPVSFNGVYFRPYWWGDENAPEASLPNFGLDGDGIEIRWYKHPGRGLSVTHDLTPGQWAAWHDRVARALHLHEWNREAERHGVHEGNGSRIAGDMLHPDDVYHWYVEFPESTPPERG